MDITIDHRDFKTQLLELRAPGYFGLPTILLNGVPVRKVDGAYTVLNDAGLEMLVTIRTGPFDPLPQLLIEQEAIRLIGRPGWTQFAGWRQSAGFRMLGGLWSATRKVWRWTVSAQRVKKPRKSVQG